MAFEKLILSCTEVVEPVVAYRTPPAAPPTQRSVPLVLATPRGLLALAKSFNAVVVSMAAFASIRPTLRGTLADVVPTSPVVGIGAS